MSPVTNALLAGLMLLGQAAPAPVPPPTKEEIQKAIEDLSADNFQTRQKASLYLRNAGKVTEPYLIEALNGAGLEVSQRIDAILKDFKWGIYPDTPQKVVDQINRYRGGDAKVKRQVMAELVRANGPGFFALLKIAGAEEDGNLRRTGFDLVAREMSPKLPALLMEGQYSLVEELLELALAGDDEAAPRNLAAYLLLRNRLDARIPHYKKRVGMKEPVNAALVLTYLYRAKGDLAAARTAADASGDPALVTRILIEQRDWSALAKQFAARDETVEVLNFRAAFQRLSGDKAAFEKTVASLSQVTYNSQLEDSERIRLAAKGLFLNDQSEQGIALLVAHKQYVLAFEVLAAQMKYREAFEVLDKLPAEGRAVPVQLRHALVLHQLGEAGQALAMLTKTGETLKESGLFAGYRDLIRTEQRLGMTELAYSHAVQGLAHGWNDERPSDLFNLFFPDRGAVAEVWWAFFCKKYPAEQRVDTMRRVRDIFEKRQAPKDFLELVQELEKSDERAEAGRRMALLGISGACQALGREDLEADYLDKLAELADRTELFLRRGTLFANQKKYREAAAQFQKAWEMDKTQPQPLPLFLRGWALEQGGQGEEGKKLMELAHLIPLASDEARYAFARGLAERGHSEAAQRQREWLLRVSSLAAPSAWEVNETLRLVGYEAMRRGQHARAAELLEEFRIRCLSPETSFADGSGVIHVPAIVYREQALALAAAGKLEEAKKAAGLALAAMPGNVNVVIPLVAALDGAGRKADADEIFVRMLATFKKVTEAYPRSGMAHNSMAWLCAACRRELDQGLEHAQKASELEPKNPLFRDSLAEVLFQRGDTAKAIEQMKRCLEADPGNSYYQQQLKRFEAGDPKVKVPET